MLGKGRVAVGALLFITGVAFGYSIALYRSRERAAAPAATKTLGPWAVTFKVPGSAQLPDKAPLLKLEFDRTALPSELKMTVSNLTDQPYVVTYGIYGYNTKGIRVCGDVAKFAIGRHESVLRQSRLTTYGSGLPSPLDPQIRLSRFALSVQLGQ